MCFQFRYLCMTPCYYCTQCFMFLPWSVFFCFFFAWFLIKVMVVVTLGVGSFPSCQKFTILTTFSVFEQITHSNLTTRYIVTNHIGGSQSDDAPRSLSTVSIKSFYFATSYFNITTLTGITYLKREIITTDHSSVDIFNHKPQRFKKDIFYNLFS